MPGLRIRASRIPRNGRPHPGIAASNTPDRTSSLATVHLPGTARRRTAAYRQRQRSPHCFPDHNAINTLDAGICHVSKALDAPGKRIAAVLVVGALIAGFLILFTAHHTTLVGGNAPSNANSVIFVAFEDDGTVYAVRPSDGALYWQHTIGHKLTSAPVASQDAVFAGSYDGHIYALRRSDGSLTWSSPAIPGSAVQPNFTDSTAVYVSATSGIYAFNAIDGYILWCRSIHRRYAS